MKREYQAYIKAVFSDLDSTPGLYLFCSSLIQAEAKALLPGISSEQRGSGGGGRHALQGVQVCLVQRGTKRGCKDLPT